MINTGQFRKDQVVDIINSVLKKVETTEHHSMGAIRDELQNLRNLIDALRGEFSVGSGAIRGEHIPDATDQLDAVVASTAEATGTIMDCCEGIEKISEEYKDKIPQAVADKLVDSTTKIYEACSFQDLTGQRVNKVISTLKHIDEKICAMLEAYPVDGGGDSTKASATPSVDTRTGDEALLNGPQLPGKSISQEEIDKLLEGFD